MKRLLRPFFLLALYTTATGQANFTDVSAAAGINNLARNFGISIVDFDNDGREDLYVSTYYSPNLLYRSLGNGRFVNVAEAAGVAHDGTSTMSCWGDIDNDGDLDMYLGNRLESNALYLNNGDGTFTGISESAGVNSAHHTRAVMFGDIDRDGYIDLYVANLSGPNYLYHNNGDLTFTNIMETAGAQDFGLAMGSLFFDYDNDGDLDIYLVHDGNQPNILYQNDGSGLFTDVSRTANADFAGQGMGVDFGDVNNDGFFDLYITNLYPNALLVSNGNGTFRENTLSSQAGDPGMGWGTVWLDYDNDGLQDLYVSNDSYFSPHPNVLYRNLGNNAFEIVSGGSPLSSMFAGYGVATADLNTDGKIDLFLANSANDGNQLFLNYTENGNNWVKARLRGTISNRAAIGARVEIEAGGLLMMDEVCAGGGYASQNSLILHFGLGPAATIGRLKVRWPNGLEEEYFNLDVNTSYLLTEGEGLVVSQSQPTPPAAELKAWPNPFSEQLHLQLDLKQESFLQLYLQDMHGRKVALLADGRYSAGQHRFGWQAAPLPHGIYFLRLQTEHGIHSLPLALQR